VPKYLNSATFSDILFSYLCATFSVTWKRDRTNQFIVLPLPPNIGYNSIYPADRPVNQSHIRCSRFQPLQFSTSVILLDMCVTYQSPSSRTGFLHVCPSWNISAAGWFRVLSQFHTRFFLLSACNLHSLRARWLLPSRMWRRVFW
jgi:hypothetical protein